MEEMGDQSKGKKKREGVWCLCMVNCGKGQKLGLPAVGPMIFCQWVSRTLHVREAGINLTFPRIGRNPGNIYVLPLYPPFRPHQMSLSEP